jgi:hypothetical protein
MLPTLFVMYFVFSPNPKNMPSLTEPLVLATNSEQRDCKECVNTSLGNEISKKKTEY